MRKELGKSLPLVAETICPNVRRYFLRLRDGTGIALDGEGTIFENMGALRTAVLQSARHCIAGDVVSGGVVDLRCRIDAEDEEGRIVDTLPFDQAVSVVTP